MGILIVDFQAIADSTYRFHKFSGKPVEFDKGKSGIAVASVEKLPGVIDTLIAAVRTGELDTRLRYN